MKHCTRISLFVLTLAVISLAGGTVFAQTATDNAEQQDDTLLSTPSEELPVENPYMNKIRLTALDLAKTLSQEQLQILQDIRVGFGMVRSVKMVKGDVMTAADLCRKNVPELDQDMIERAESWGKALEAAVAESEKQMETLVSRDVFGDHYEDVMAYLELKDKAAKHADDQLQKSIVTDEKTCNTLYESMANTKDELIAVLDNIPWPALEEAADTSDEAAATNKDSED